MSGGGFLEERARVYEGCGGYLRSRLVCPLGKLDSGGYGIG